MAPSPTLGWRGSPARDLSRHDIFIYAVGAPRPLREPSWEFFIEHADRAADLVTSAEVLQELLYVYSRQGRWATLDAALRLATSLPTIVPVTEADVMLARSLVSVTRSWMLETSSTLRAADATE